MNSNRLYGADLAFIHDVGFAGHARRATPALLAILRQSAITAGLVVDLGCGSGIWARELAQSGYDVLGVDVSSAMIRLSKKRVPRGRFMKGSLFRIELPRCVAVTALGECFNFMPEGWGRDNLLRHLFSEVFEALNPGGVFIFDLAEPGRETEPHRRYFEGRGWVVLLEVELDPGRDRLTRRITCFRRVGRFYKRSVEIHRIQLWRRSFILEELRGAGFRVRTMSGYGKYRFPRGVVGFLAQKSRSGRL